MAKYKVSAKGSLVTIKQKQFHKFIYNECELEIFEENMISGLFRPNRVNNNKIIYTAPAGISLKNYIKKGITIHKLYSVLAQVVEITKQIERHNLYIYNLVLDEKMIFVKELTGELYFLYEPIKSKENYSNIYTFLTEFVFDIKLHQRALREECMEILEFLKSPDNYRIVDIENLIQQRYPQIYQQIAYTEPVKEERRSSGELSLSHCNNISTQIQPQMLQDGTVLLKEEQTNLLEEETVLLQQDMPNARLMRRCNQQEQIIDKTEFCIGKDSAMDLCILDNNTISRKHATIVLRNNNYYIIDENSRNHTYLNGVRVSSLSGELLQNGDVIRLADEEFDFKVM